MSIISANAKEMTADAEPDLETISCCVTSESKQVRVLKSGKPALPAGWKRIGERYFSGTGWQQRFVMRVIRVPVAGVELPVNSPEESRQAWAELRKALQISWRQATQLSNWLITELAKVDTAPLIDGPRGSKLPKMPSMGPLLKRLYHPGREQWPELDSQSFASIRQKVVAKYLQVRFELRCRASVSLPNYRYPTPLPIQAKDVRFLDQNGQLLMQVRISGKRFTLRLRGGREFKRSTNAIRKMITGELLHGEVSLLERVVGSRRPGSGRDRISRRPTRLMVNVSVWLPRQSGPSGQRICSVKTSKDRLWTVLLDGCDDPWNLNEDQIRRWSAAYYRQLQRLREDTKLDRRQQSPDDLARRRSDLQRKFQNRIKDACHKASAMLIGFCKRHHVGKVEYNDGEKGWLEDFPWHRLREYCSQKCQQSGIEFEHAIEPVRTESTKTAPDRESIQREITKSDKPAENSHGPRNGAEMP